MPQTPTTVRSDLVDRIRREFPDRDLARADRLVEIFVELMTEIIEKARRDLERKVDLRDALVRPQSDD
jgi:hypothetical protein